MSKAAKTGYLTDVSDEEWAFVLPYLLLSKVDSASREHDLRAIFNAVRYVVKGGNQWRLMPNDLPPWPAAYQQMRRWMRAGCFERIVEDVQSLLRQFGGRKGQPTAVCIAVRSADSLRVRLCDDAACHYSHGRHHLARVVFRLERWSSDGHCGRNPLPSIPMALRTPLGEAWPHRAAGTRCRRLPLHPQVRCSAASIQPMHS